MNEIAIKRHSFDLAKNRLKEFSEKTEAELQIDKVRTDGGFFGLGDHKVTGYELNRRLETIQGHFIAVNTTNNEVIKEFREVYNALDKLDKDYITSIVANVKAIEKTSNDVRVQQGILKQHNEKLANQQNKLDVHQVEIEKNVENISKIVTALKVFKEKLEGYKHLTDIDIIWNDCKMIQNKIRVVSDRITNFSKKTMEDIDSVNNKNKALSDQVNRDIITLRNEAKSFKEFFADLSKKIDYTADLLDNQIPVIQETAAFSEQLKIKVDDVWKHTENHKLCIKNLEQVDKVHTDKLDELVQSDSRILQRIDSNEGDINDLKSYKEKLNGIYHLEDVDNIWKSVEEHTSQLTESRKRDDELAYVIQKNKDEVDKKIADVVQTANSNVEYLTKRIKYAYWIAGGSAGLAIIELILLIMKVI
ncbi:MAG: hypothetical protein IAC13_07730 [Firmicutes bacterium]|uniref:Uncharacterized protein n=1 Tax=Candidatus Scybalomonas excrementavium TaxID=2840943 RepID=A0A9D9N866_9FIRM|nr:hypothetical protein [Candidatus Scybalomonas excrementavium]